MSKRGHIPIRMCIGCGKRRRKEEMIRFIRMPDRVIVPERSKDQKGRGSYLCLNPGCLREAERKKRVSSLDGVIRMALDLGLFQKSIGG